MVEFAVDVIRTIGGNRTLPITIIDQITRSASSIGANYAEACNATSKQDFRNKIYIAKKEAAETRYWLTICEKLNVEVDWSIIKEESRQPLLILQSIINVLKTKA